MAAAAAATATHLGLSVFGEAADVYRASSCTVNNRPPVHAQL